MTNTKNFATKNNVQVVENNILRSTVLVQTSEGLRASYQPDALPAAGLYDNLKEVMETITDEGGSKMIYLKLRSNTNVDVNDFYHPFVEYFAPKLAQQLKSNVFLLFESGGKNKRWFAVSALYPRSNKMILARILLSNKRSGIKNVPEFLKESHQTLLEMAKEMTMPYLNWERVKVLGSVATVVAKSFGDSEIRVYAGEGGEGVIVIPLRRPKWSLNDFPDELAEELRTLVVEPIKSGMKVAPKGLLLLGPPGVGKTLMVEAIAKELGKKIMELDPGTYRSMWYGQTEKILKNILKKAMSRDDIVILLDDAEFLMDRGMSVHEAYVSEMNIFLKMLQAEKRPLIAMTTNHPQLMDQALIRPGRIDVLIAVGYPDKKFRRKIVENVLKRYGVEASEEMKDKIVRVTKWFSNAEIDALIRMAVAKGKGKITDESLMWARNRFNINETERQRMQEGIKWFVNKMQGMVISYVKEPSEV